MATQTFDADGRLIKTVDEEGAETSYVYDGCGRVVKMTDALLVLGVHPVEGGLGQAAHGIVLEQGGIAQSIDGFHNPATGVQHIAGPTSTTATRTW